jgi:hypothetical protein
MITATGARVSLLDTGNPDVEDSARQAADADDPPDPVTGDHDLTEAERADGDAERESGAAQEIPASHLAEGEGKCHPGFG